MILRKIRKKILKTIETKIEQKKGIFGNRMKVTVYFTFTLF